MRRNRILWTFQFHNKYYLYVQCDKVLCKSSKPISNKLPKLILKKAPLLALTLREKCPYSEFFWSAFSRIRTEYEEILCISPYLVRMRENTEQKNFKYGHLSRNVTYSHDTRSVKRIGNTITNIYENVSFHFVLFC